MRGTEGVDGEGGTRSIIRNSLSRFSAAAWLLLYRASVTAGNFFPVPVYFIYGPFNSQMHQRFSSTSISAAFRSHSCCVSSRFLAHSAVAYFTFRSQSYCAFSYSSSLSFSFPLIFYRMIKYIRETKIFARGKLEASI